MRFRKAGPNGAATIESEDCRLGSNYYLLRGGVLDHSAANRPGLAGDRPALVGFGGTAEFHPDFSLISGLTFYAPNPERMRRPAAIRSG